MIQTVQAKNITLRDLIDQFDLELVQDDDFFREWQDNLPAITELEKQMLDRVKAGYFNLMNNPPLLEKTIQIAIAAPILHLAGFFLPPFHIKTEQSIEIEIEDEGILIKGSLDVLILKEQLWLLIIESKRAAFSIEAGLGQILAYMLGSPHPNQPSFGMITTGGSFIFLKLVKGERPQYAASRIFELRNPGNDLYNVLSILKRISQL
ncbi:MAG: restriction endonuclease subunit R [Leptolyngbyaceae bacterium]|nr:restriction endonuclease subunit R [Leptolyngbyaceae bacterium]